MARFFRYALILFGECILLAVILFLLPADRPELTCLNALSLSIAYLANIFGYPILLNQQQESEVAGYGIAWWSTWIYSVAILVVTVLSYLIYLPFSWQVVLHGALLFFYLIGMYWSYMAVHHAEKLEVEYNLEARGVEILKVKAQMLQTLLYEEMREDVKQEITEVVERTRYLIPNRSVLSSALEKQIDSLLDALSDAISTRQPDEKISSLAIQCKTSLKQRMAIPA